LVNGEGEHEGRVEVLYSGIWGTVCNDFFDLADADVVCRQLGYPGALRVGRFLEFGQGTGPIWLDDVRCTGNETSIEQCPSRAIGSHNCFHFEDVGVECIRKIDNNFIQKIRITMILFWLYRDHTSSSVCSKIGGWCYRV